MTSSIPATSGPSPSEPPSPPNGHRALPDAHALPVDEVARALAVDPARGLSADEAARRLESVGANELEPPRHESVLHMFFEAATEPFVILLAIAGVLAVIVGEGRDGLLVLFGLIPIVGADVVTEYRGQRALEALREASAPTTRARRDGEVEDLLAMALVPGDVVLLRAGDVVPADLRISRAEGLLLDRSILTGESLPEPATVDPDPPEATLNERHALAYAGTSVVAGRAEGIVVATGAASEVGVIAKGLEGDERRRSPLQRELDRLVKILLVVAIGLIAITFGLGVVRGNPLGENILAGVSAAIAAIPEEPPILLAVVLGLGAYRLLKRGVLVRHLNAEETLGAVDLILTDKTGTLTENRLAVRAVRTPDGEVTDPDRRRSLLARRPAGRGRRLAGGRGRAPELIHGGPAGRARGSGCGRAAGDRSAHRLRPGRRRPTLHTGALRGRGRSGPCRGAWCSRAALGRRAPGRSGGHSWRPAPGPASDWSCLRRGATSIGPRRRRSHLMAVLASRPPLMHRLPSPAGSRSVCRARTRRPAVPRPTVPGRLWPSSPSPTRSAAASPRPWPPRRGPASTSWWSPATTRPRRWPSPRRRAWRRRAW